MQWVTLLASDVSGCYSTTYLGQVEFSLYTDKPILQKHWEPETSGAKATTVNQCPLKNENNGILNTRRTDHHSADRTAVHSADTINTNTKDHKSLDSASNTKYQIPIALKITALFVLPLLLGMSALSYIMLETHRAFQNEQMDKFAQLITGQLAASAIEPLFADANMELGVLVNQVSLDDALAGVGIYSHQGEPIALSGLLPSAKNIDFVKKKSLIPAEFLSGETQALFNSGIIYSTPIRFRMVTGGYAIVVFNPSSSLTDGVDKMAYALISSTLILFILLSVIIFFMSRRVAAPIKTIADATAGFNSGKFDFIPERRNDELGQLIKSINRMSQGLAKKSQVETVLAKFLAPDIADKIINELDTVKLSGENVEATALFADIVGFTNMSESLSPQEVSELLNEYFGYYASCAKLYFGTVDKFLGDCVMIIFGAAKHDPQHQYHAVACALLMQQLTDRVNQDRISKGKFAVHLRIGINSGKMMAGLLGSQDRMEYTVIGDAVNLASRLCNEAEKNQVIIQQDCYTSLKPHYKMQVDGEKNIKIRGKKDPVSIYNVTHISQSRSSGNAALIDDLMKNIQGQRQ